MEDRFHQDLVGCLPELRRYARKLACNPADAEDLVQDCLVRALSREHLFERGTNLAAWLMTILRNHFFNGCEKQRRRPPPAELGENTASVAPTTARLELRDAQRALADLTQDQRQIIHLCALEGLAYQEAAAHLGVSIGTIRSRLSRARQKLSRLTGVDRMATRSEGHRPRNLGPDRPRPPASEDRRFAMPASALPPSATQAGHARPAANQPPASAPTRLPVRQPRPQAPRGNPVSIGRPYAAVARRSDRLRSAAAAPPASTTDRRQAVPMSVGRGSFPSLQKPPKTGGEPLAGTILAVPNPIPSSGRPVGVLSGNPELTAGALPNSCTPRSGECGRSALGWMSCASEFSRAPGLPSRAWRREITSAHPLRPRWKAGRRGLEQALAPWDESRVSSAHERHKAVQFGNRSGTDPPLGYDVRSFRGPGLRAARDSPERTVKLLSGFQRWRELGPE